MPEISVFKDPAVTELVIHAAEKPVLRISESEITVHPDVAVDEAAKGVIDALAEHLKLLAAEKDERIKQLEDALLLGIRARQAQKSYFKNRSKDALILSKTAEADFDRAWRGVLTPPDPAPATASDIGV